MKINCYNTCQILYPSMNHKLKLLSMPFKAARKAGYVNTGVRFKCRQNFNQSRLGKMDWLQEIYAIVDHIDAECRKGKDVVAVVHGFYHPEPDVVATYIYTKLKA